MPLLKKKPFQRNPEPPDLRKDEEVFHCVMTNEIFREYDEYCQRVILCNSMVWTCSMTGKQGLTYTEALESEHNAQQVIKDFPTELRIPLLFLASKTQRTSFLDMVEDVFAYAKDRYFIGENVEASFTGNKWKESHILQVIAPTEEQVKNGPKNGHSTDRHFVPPASLYRYEVEQLDAEEEDVSEVMIVDCYHIKRKKTTFSRDRCKLFLKQFVELNPLGVVAIKESVLGDYAISKMKFDQIFDGPLPNFDTSKKLQRTVTANGKKVRQETIAQFLKKNNGVLPSENTINLMEQMKKRQEEFQQMKENIKQKKADDKLAEKQKRKEENIKISMILKDWYKPKEDLELEDHKILPVPAPIQSKVPDKYMGDVLAIVEFVRSFLKLLHFKDFFPDGLSLELMERALTQKEVAGPLTDIIQMFLTALFNVQSDEASQQSTDLENSSDIHGKDLNGNISLTEATHFATAASNWSVTHQGLPLSKLPLYALTTSEILRLHLLSSGARIKEAGAKWRYQHRGGYTSEDDPGLYFRLKHPHILKALALHNITELSIGDKLKIIHCLMNQLLTYADVRDAIEDRLEKSKQAKFDLKSLQITERRREQEYITAKLKIKKEAKENKQDPTIDLEKLSKEAEKKKAQHERKMENLMQQVTEHQILLGQDRAYRKYFKLESVPGLFVNFYEENPGSCLNECVNQNPELVGADRSQTLVHVRKIYEEMNTSDKENHQEEEKDGEPQKVNGVRKSLTPENDLDTLLVCSADPSNCIVHSNKHRTQTWSFYHDAEQIEELVSSLNTRGLRESDLRQAIVNEQEHLISLVTSTPATYLNPSVEVQQKIIESDEKPKPKRLTGKTKYDDTNLGYPLDMNSASILQFALIDNILELEEKIFAGSLGSIKVKDRTSWREHLNNRQFDSIDKTLLPKTDNSRLDKVKKDGKNSRPNTPDTSKEYRDPGRFLGATENADLEDSDAESDEVTLFQTDDQKLAIQSIAICLIQIGQGVEHRYLKKPLGNAGMRQDAKRTKEYNVLERWEHSLLAATSYSQIFLHYSTLDSCIMWSRSALLARCQICRRQTDSENMLLCDNCNKGHHLYCLKPKLTSVPKGDWFCKDCQKRKDKEAKLKNPEIKSEPQKKRRIFKEELSDDEGSVQNSEPSSESFEPPKKISKIKEEMRSDEESSEQSTPDVEEDADENYEDIEMTEADTDEQIGSDGLQPKVEVCTRCGEEGTLLCCDKCPDLYHLECAEPPLRRVPRGMWFCHKCKVKKNRENTDSDSNSDEVTSTRRSNRREIETRDDLPLHNAPLQELLSDVLKQEQAWPFLRPVQKTEVPDYYNIITKPMDFGTIKYKLNMGEYKRDADLMEDVILVFENCNTYNNSHDEVYKCGANLLKYFVSRCQNLGLQLPQTFKELQKEIENEIDPPESKMMLT